MLKRTNISALVAIMILALLPLNMSLNSASAQVAERCLNFQDFKDGEIITPGTNHLGFDIDPFGNGRITEILDGQRALQFPAKGVRITLSQPSDFVTVKTVRFGQQNILIKAFAGILKDQDINDSPAGKIHLSYIGMVNANLDTVIIYGGEGDGMLLEICLVDEPPVECLEFDASDLGITFGAGLDFMIDGYHLMAIQTQPQSVIDIVPIPGGEVGITFPDSGMKIALPFTTSQVTVRLAGVDDEDMSILVSDSMGEGIADAIVTSTGSVEQETFDEPGINEITVAGGNGGGRLISICLGRIPPEEAPACDSFVDFAAFSPGDILGPDFAHNDFEFISPSVDYSQINAIGFKNALMFRDSGLDINLPQPGQLVIVNAGAFAGSNLVVVALDGSGTIVDSTIVPPGNSISTVILSGDISSLVLEGGGGEGMLDNICVLEF